MNHDHKHYHKNEKGLLVSCYHSCRNSLASWQFWIGTFISTLVSFPLEHYLYEKVWPFYILTKWLGL